MKFKIEVTVEVPSGYFPLTKTDIMGTAKSKANRAVEEYLKDYYGYAWKTEAKVTEIPDEREVQYCDECSKPMPGRLRKA